MCIVHVKYVQLFYRTKMTADMSINVDFVVGKGGGGGGGGEGGAERQRITMNFKKK